MSRMGDDFLRNIEIGLTRLENEADYGACCHESMSRITADSHEVITTQLTRTGDKDKLLVIYVELLRRTERFVNFVDDNVGRTEEYPIYIEGVTEGAELRFFDLLEGLRNAGGCLVELQTATSDSRD